MKNLIALSNETISTSIQSDYIAYHRKIDHELFDEKETLKESSKLFLPNTHIEEKRRILFLLAHIGTKKAFALLQRYITTADKELVTWSLLAFEECKQHMVGDEFLVLTEAGGEAGLMRFYFILTSKENVPLTDRLKEVVQKESIQEKSIVNCITEDIVFGNTYCIVMALISPDTAPATYIEHLITQCNKQQEFLRFHYLCTNTQKPSSKEIKEYVTYMKMRKQK